MAAAGKPVNYLDTAIMAAGVDHCIADDGIPMTRYGADILSRSVMAVLDNA